MLNEYSTIARLEPPSIQQGHPSNIAIPNIYRLGTETNLYNIYLFYETPYTLLKGYNYGQLK